MTTIGRFSTRPEAIPDNVPLLRSNIELSSMPMPARFFYRTGAAEGCIFIRIVHCHSYRPCDHDFPAQNVPVSLVASARNEASRAGFKHASNARTYQRNFAETEIPRGNGNTRLQRGSEMIVHSILSRIAAHWIGFRNGTATEVTAGRLYARMPACSLLSIAGAESFVRFNRPVNRHGTIVM